MNLEFKNLTWSTLTFQSSWWTGPTMKLDEGLSQAFTLAHPPWKHPTVLPAALALQSLFAHGKIQPQRSLQLQRTDARWVKGAPPITATILTFTVARLLRPGIHMFLLQKNPIVHASV